MSSNKKQIVGWREWVLIPDLSDFHIKAKVDTGAKTSALHAFLVEPYEKQGEAFVKFGIHPIQGSNEEAIVCHAPVADHRQVTDSGGHREMRYVIAVDVTIGSITKKIELTLTDRDSMAYRMLLGRNALKKNFVVDSSRSYLLGGGREYPPESNSKK